MYSPSRAASWVVIGIQQASLAILAADVAEGGTLVGTAKEVR
jgi:hypothetical protein